MFGFICKLLPISFGQTQLLGPQTMTTNSPSAADQDCPATKRPTPSTSDLDDSVLALIGKCNDSEVSRRTGISVGRIASTRVRLGIAPVRYWAPLDPGLLESLGTMPDQEVATKFGRTLKWVRKERAKRAIPKFTGSHVIPKLEKNAELLALLGKCSDRSLGARFGCTGKTISSLRERLGIPQYRHDEVSANKEQWDKHRDEAIALLGKVSDSELARRFGGFQCRYSYLRNQAGIPALYPRRAVSEKAG